MKQLMLLFLPIFNGCVPCHQCPMEQYKQIELGMYQNQVFQLISAPATYYYSEEHGVENWCWNHKWCNECDISIWFNSNGRCCTITHGHNGKVVDVKFDKSIADEEAIEPVDN